ncbi:MAG: bifunctional nuclease domain-containing protein [Dehalococcoidia bacterium]
MIEMTIDSIRVSLMNYQRVVILKEKVAERYLPIWIGPAEADAIAVKLQDVSVPRPLTHDLLSSIISSLGAAVSSIIVCDLSNDTFYAKIVLTLSDGLSDISKPISEDTIVSSVEEAREVAIRMSLPLVITSVGTPEESGAEVAYTLENLETIVSRLLSVPARHPIQVRLGKSLTIDSRPSDAIALAVRSSVPIFAEDSVLEKAGVLLDKETGKPLPLDQEGKGKTVDEEELKRMSAFRDFIDNLDLEDFGKGRAKD